MIRRVNKFNSIYLNWIRISSEKMSIQSLRSSLITVAITGIIFMLQIQLSITGNVGQKNINQTNICNKKQVDKCAISLVPLTDPELLQRPPKTLADLDHWCRKFKRSEKCVRQYSDQCLASESRRTLSIVLYSISKTLRRYCGQTKRKQELLNLSHCLDNDLTNVSKVLFELSGDMHAIRSIEPANMRIPLCCW